MATLSSKKRTTRKLPPINKATTILVPDDQKYREMHTTDRNRIQMYIDSSNYMIDPDVIHAFNIQAQELTVSQLDRYLWKLTPLQNKMICQFQAIIQGDLKIHRILRKECGTENEEIHIMNWRASNHSFYRQVYLDKGMGAPDYMEYLDKNGNPIGGTDSDSDSDSDEVFSPDKKKVT
jgi:hypothetical protein